MRNTTKVRVKTAQLLAAVRAKKDAQDKAYNKARDEYPAKMEKYRAAVVSELRSVADREPTRDTSIERTIKTLEMAADDAISITAEDYARYLGV